MLSSAICMASHQGKLSCCRWQVCVIHLPTQTLQDRAESMHQAPNPQQPLSTRVKKGLWMSVRLPQSSHNHQMETECLAKVITCFISLRAYRCPASEDRVSLRWPPMKNSQPCKLSELWGHKGPSSKCSWHKYHHTHRPIHPLRGRVAGRGGGGGWNVSSLWPPAAPKGPTQKVTRWLKPWSLSLICARVMIFFF